MKNWTEHYVKQEMVSGWDVSGGSSDSDWTPRKPTHKEQLKIDLVKLRQNFPKKKPLKWISWYMKQNKMRDELENYPEHYPEYFI